MNKFLLFISVLLVFSACKPEQKVRVINVKDFGIEANTYESITGKINKLTETLGEEPTLIVFPKGRYDFWPDSNYFKPYYETNTYDVNPKRLAIFLENKKNITIDAQESDFIYHDHIQPFTLDNSENITIKNVNIDWEKPLTAEAEVLEADAKHIKVKIDTFQFPYKVHDKGLTFKAEGWEADWKLTSASWLIEMNREDHIIPANTGDSGCVRGNLDAVKYIDLEPGIVLMKGEFTKTPGVGNYLILRHSTRDHAGMFFFHSKNIKLENINIHHTSGLGILSQYCENIEMRKVNNIPNPHKNRYLAGHDDALHFMGCKGELIIDSCRALGLMDDPINVHGTCVTVVEKTGSNSVICKFAHKMSLGLIWCDPGDRVSFIEKKPMVPLAIATVSKFTVLDEWSFSLEFEEDIPEYIDDGYSIENLTWTPNVSITNCFAGSCRARGYLISTPGKVVVENNIFETSGTALLIAGDANYWFESGAITDLTIRNNEFRWPCNSTHYQFCKAIITIFPEVPEADPSRPFHRNILIENNTFNPSDIPIIYALSVDGLTFKNNLITRSYEYEPWHYQKHNLHLVACKNVEISGNTLGEDVPGKNILLEGMDRSELKISNEEFSIEEKKLGEIELMKQDDAFTPKDH
jgi:hypothetical protein